MQPFSQRNTGISQNILAVETYNPCTDRSVWLNT